MKFIKRAIIRVLSYEEIANKHGMDIEFVEKWYKLSHAYELHNKLIGKELSTVITIDKYRDAHVHGDIYLESCEYEIVRFL